MEKQEMYKSQWDGPVKVVPPEDVELLTLQGWVVLDNVEHDVVEMSYHDAVNPNPRPTDTGHQDYYSYQPTLPTTQPLLVRRRQFVLGLPKETLLQELNDKLATLQTELTESQNKVAEHDKIVQAQTGEINLAKANSDCYKKRSEESSLTCDSLRATLRQMEIDMAKVRGEIGDGQWRKIVEGPDE